MYITVIEGIHVNIKAETRDFAVQVSSSTPNICPHCSGWLESFSPHLTFTPMKHQISTQGSVGDDTSDNTYSSFDSIVTSTVDTTKL